MSRHPKVKLLPKDEREIRDREIARLYTGGQSLSQIAQAYALTMEGVRQILLRSAVRLRSSADGIRLRQEQR